MSDNKHKDTNKQFGVIFSIFFLIIFFFSLYKDNPLSHLYLAISAICILITLIKSNLFHYPNVIWISLGNFLGMIMTPILLGFFYFIFFVLIGIILKIFNKDVLELKIKKNINSYWTKTSFKETDFDKQF